MSDLVSIVVPVYKVPENYLKKCIGSLIEDKNNNIEIILVDDGSPDKCGTICDSYAEKDNRIKVIHQKNSGLSGARNSGIKASKGEWVTFLDGDDYIDICTMENVLSEDFNDAVDVIMLGMVKEFPNRCVRYSYSIKSKNVYDQVACKTLQKKILDFKSNLSSPCSKLYRREVLLKNELLFDEDLRQGIEGIDFNLRVFNYIRGYVFVDEIFYHYKYNSESISAKPTTNNNLLIIAGFEKIKNNFFDFADEEFKTLFYTRLAYVIVTSAVSGYFNPDYGKKYSEKVKEFSEFLEINLIKETFTNVADRCLDKNRRLAFLFIKHRMYFAINFIAKIRKIRIYGR